MRWYGAFLERALGIVSERIVDAGMDSDLTTCSPSDGSLARASIELASLFCLEALWYCLQILGLLYCDGSFVNMPFSTPRKYDHEWASSPAKVDSSTLKLQNCQQISTMCHHSAGSYSQSNPRLWYMPSSARPPTWHERNQMFQIAWQATILQR